MSNPIRNIERTMAAQACLMIAKFQGEVCALKVLDADPVNLYMLPYSIKTTNGQYQKMRSDASSGKFDIPLQVGFDGTLPSGSSIAFDGTTYQINEVDSDDLNAVFTAKCTAQNARQI